MDEGKTSFPASLAIVHDAMPYMGGAERVLESAFSMYPAATLYALVRNKAAFKGTSLQNAEVISSFVDRLPAAKTSYRSYLPLLPFAIEQLDLSAHELVVSFHYAVAHGVLLRPEQLHISYTFSPLRAAWHSYPAYLHSAGLKTGIRGWMVKWLLHYFRLWDWAAAQRVDVYVAASEWVARCIWRAYRREAQVIYPPVDIRRFEPHYPRQDYYVSLARLVPHKQVSLVVDVFGELGLPLYVVGEGPQSKQLRRRAAPNVKFLGWLPDEKVADLLGTAKALVHAAEEDFGIALVEAQASGCPVIAYGRGGSRETVVQGETGYLFGEQSHESLVEAVERFEGGSKKFHIPDLVESARRFDRNAFQLAFSSLLIREWEKFSGVPRHENAGYEAERVF